MSQIFTFERFSKSLSNRAFAVYLRWILPGIAWPDPEDEFQFLKNVFQKLKNLGQTERIRVQAAAADLFTLWQDRDNWPLLNELTDDVRAVLPEGFALLSVPDRFAYVAALAPDFMERIYLRQRCARGPRCRSLTRVLRLPQWGAQPQWEPGGAYPAEKLEAFAARVSEFVFAREECGRFYRVRHFAEPGEAIDCFLLTLSGHPCPVEQWTESGAMEETLVRETFDMLFRFDRVRRTLTVRARGSATDKTALCRICAETVFDADLEPDPNIPEYDLARFLTHDGPIYPAADSPIQSVLCVGIAYRNSGNPTGVYIYQDVLGRPGQAIRWGVDHRNIPYEAMTAQSVKLKFYFNATASRHKCATVEVRRDSVSLSAGRLPPVLRAAIARWIDSELRVNVPAGAPDTLLVNPDAP